jgi:hypothetical protein
VPLPAAPRRRTSTRRASARRRRWRSRSSERARGRLWALWRRTPGRATTIFADPHRQPRR